MHKGEVQQCEAGAAGEGDQGGGDQQADWEAGGETEHWWGEEVDESGDKKFLQSEEGGCQGGRRCFWWNQNWDNVLQQRSVWMFCVILFYILKWFFFKNDQIQFFFSQLFKFN